MSPLSAVMVVVLIVSVEGEDLTTSDSSLHYTYHHSYGYADHHSPYHGYKHKYGHHQADLGYAGGYHHSSGYHSSHLHSHSAVPVVPPPPPPPYHGYVPHPLDHVEGQAFGHDLVGPFYHHSGPFGPFGFYANFFHDRK